MTAPIIPAAIMLEMILLLSMSMNFYYLLPDDLETPPPEDLVVPDDLETVPPEGLYDDELLDGVKLCREVDALFLNVLLLFLFDELDVL